MDQLPMDQLRAQAQIYRPGEDLRRRREAGLRNIILRGQLAQQAIQYDPTANSHMTEKKLRAIIERGQLMAAAKALREIAPRTDEKFASMTRGELESYIAATTRKAASAEYAQTLRRRATRDAAIKAYTQEFARAPDMRMSTARMLEETRKHAVERYTFFIGGTPDMRMSTEQITALWQARDLELRARAAQHLGIPVRMPVRAPEPSYRVITEDQFRHFRQITVEMKDVTTPETLYGLFVKIGNERNITRQQPWLRLEYNDASGENRRWISIHPNYLGSLQEFLDRLSDIEEGKAMRVDASGGSDPIDTDNYQLNMHTMRIAWMTISGNGSAEFVFAKIRTDAQKAHDKKYPRKMGGGHGVTCKRGRCPGCVPGCLWDSISDKIREYGLTTPFRRLAQEMGLDQMVDEPRRFSELLRQLGFGLRIYCDFPADYETAPLSWAMINKKRYRVVPCTQLKIFEQDDNAIIEKKLIPFELVWGNNHFEPYYGIEDNEVYESANKDFHWRKRGTEDKLQSIKRQVVVSNGKLRSEAFEQTVVVYDLETVFSSVDDGKLHAYSNSWVHCITEGKDYGNGLKRPAKYAVSFLFGDNCIGDFIDTLVSEQKDQMYCLAGYNSSRFDNIFLVPELLKRDLLDDVFYQGNSLLNVKWGGRHNTFDICRYTMAPLKKACADFGTKYKKMGDFDHVEIQKHYKDHGELHSFFHEPDCKNTHATISDLEVKDPTDLDMHAAAGAFGCHCEKFVRLVKYNMLDVLSTYEIYEKLEEFLSDAGIIDTNKNERAFDKRTIGSAIYGLFNAESGAKLPKLELGQYNSIRSGLFAGRTQCYGGPQCDLSGTQKYTMLDVKSLYPYVMLNRDFPCGEIGSGTYEWCIETDHIGFFNVTFNQAALPVKVIPRRTKDAPLDWNYDGEITAFLSTVDIDCLIRAGATIIKIEERGIVFSETIAGAELFSCMGKFKAVKEAEDAKPKEQRNNVKRNMAKLFLNSLSGKVIEMLHVDKTVMIKNEGDMQRAIHEAKSSADMVLNEVLSKSVGIVSYSVDPEDIFKKERRPIYLGVLIYAYARAHMFDTILREYPVIYQDTDSALITHETYERFAREKPHALGSEFGQLEEEEGSDKMYKFMTIAPKNYFIMSKDDKLLKKGFKGVNLTSDKFISNVYDTPGIIESKNGSLSVDQSIAFDLYNNATFCQLKTVAADHVRFMAAMQKDGYAYVLCSSLRKSMRSTANKSAGMIYQEFTLKRITQSQGRSSALSSVGAI